MLSFRCTRRSPARRPKEKPACEFTASVVFVVFFQSNPAFADFCFFVAVFRDPDADGDASVSLAARGAHFHMTLRAAIGKNGASRSFILPE